MEHLSNWMKSYQESNTEKFNPDLINLRKRDTANLPHMLDNIGKLLEVIKGVKYLGITMETNAVKFIERANGILPIDESRYVQATLKFEVDFNDEVTEVTLPLFIPMIVNDYFFFLNGSFYSAIYQIVDRGTYSTTGAKPSLKLKTLLMPTDFRLNQTGTFSTIDDITMTGNVFTTDLFKSVNNVMFYYFAEMGVEATTEFFGFKDQIGFCDLREDDISNIDYYKFKINSKEFIYAQKSAFVENNEVNFLVTFVDMFVNIRGLTLEKIGHEDYWMKALGKLFSKNTNTQISKAEKILLSLRRILDDTTRENLAYVAAEDKENIFSILRWMAMNQDELVKEDGMDLNNKRIRLYEYILYPLVLRISNMTYQLVNKRNLTHDNIVKQLKSVTPMFVVKKLISGKTKLIRYNGCVNGIDLFASALKWTTRGPQSMGESSSTDVAINHRDLHHSYVGRLGLLSASASDPGMSGSMTPFCKTNGLFFNMDT
jgi:hypothetical protein